MKTVHDKHSIVLELREGEDVQVKFTCQAGSDADCHKSCVREQCEEGCYCNAHGREPDLQVFNECLICTWLENEGGYWWEAYTGDPVEPHSGPIEVEWSQTDETWLWTYAAPPPQRSIDFSRYQPPVKTVSEKAVERE